METCVATVTCLPSHLLFHIPALQVDPLLTKHNFFRSNSTNLQSSTAQPEWRRRSLFVGSEPRGMQRSALLPQAPIWKGILRNHISVLRKNVVGANQFLLLARWWNGFALENDCLSLSSSVSTFHLLSNGNFKKRGSKSLKYSQANTCTWTYPDGGTNMSSFLGQTRWPPCWRPVWSTLCRARIVDKTSGSDGPLSATSSSPTCFAWGGSRAGFATSVLTWRVSWGPVSSGKMR